MTTIGTLIVCVTAIVCCWIIAERWYAHRDRAVSQLRDTWLARLQACDRKLDAIETRAEQRCDEIERGVTSRWTAERKRLDELEQLCKANDTRLQASVLRGRV